MKKLLSVITLCTIFCISANAQFSIYIRLTDYSGQVLATTGVLENAIESKNNMFDPTSTQFLKVSSFNNDIVQTLNIGSTSTGAGAGKVTFNNLHITKTVDAMTPILMQNACSGVPFKTVEVFFVNNQNVVFTKYIYKLVGIKTLAWTNTCPTGCSTPMEDIAFEYGGQIIIVNKAGSSTQAGWNRVKNIPDNDPNAVIK